MRSVRSALSAAALVVALVATAIVPAYAGQARAACGPATARAAHDCCKTPVLKACCAERSGGSQQSSPAQAKAQLDPTFTPAPGIFVADLTSRVRTTGVIAVAPRAGPIDLPTLLSTLLL